MKLLQSIDHVNDYCRLAFQALISNEHATNTVKETIVQENGKVLADPDEHNGLRGYGMHPEYYELKNSRPLPLKKKLDEFYTAPITKFWANAVSRNDDFIFIHRYFFL